MSVPSFGLTEAAFLAKYRIDSTKFARCGIKWDELVAIAQHHCENYSGLIPVANYVTDRLRLLSDVHTLRLRIKDPEHLIEKIIRKNQDRSIPICRDNYENEVTDLIGIRALHLFKDQWKPIHDFVVKTWDTHEKPTAYVREGDSSKLAEQLHESGCKVEAHTYGYRSVHYVIKASPEKKVHLIELQIRTVFEEGWSEIDHQIRYPNHTKDERLEEFLVMFNRLAGSADEMGSFIKSLSVSLFEDAKRLEKMEQSLKEKEQDLAKSKEAFSDAVAKLNINETQKTGLQKRIDELTSLAATLASTNAPLRLFSNTSINAFDASSSYGITPMVLTNSGTRNFTSYCSRCGSILVETTLGSDPTAQKVCPNCRQIK